MRENPTDNNPSPVIATLFRPLPKGRGAFRAIQTLLLCSISLCGLCGFVQGTRADECVCPESTIESSEKLLEEFYAFAKVNVKTVGNLVMFGRNGNGSDKGRAFEVDVLKLYKVDDTEFPLSLSIMNMSNDNCRIVDVKEGDVLTLAFRGKGRNRYGVPWYAETGNRCDVLHPDVIKRIEQEEIYLSEPREYLAEKCREIGADIGAQFVGKKYDSEYIGCGIPTKDGGKKCVPKEPWMSDPNACEFRCLRIPDQQKTVFDKIAAYFSKQEYGRCQPYYSAYLCTEMVDGKLQLRDKKVCVY